jgi:uncharacterized delta-60 repeat protein
MKNNYTTVGSRHRAGWRSQLRTLACVLFAAMSLSASAQYGVNDPTFNPLDAGHSYGDGGLFGGFAGGNYKTILLPNGKLIQIGFEYAFNGVYTKGVHRLNVDGSVDTSFHCTGVNTAVYDGVVQPDGKLVLLGDFTQINGVSAGSIARLNVDGSIDTSFHTGTGITMLNTYKPSLVLQSDGKIIVGDVYISGYNGTTVPTLFRLNTDGTIDSAYLQNLPSHPTTGNGMTLLSNGKLMLAGVQRLNTDGTPDSTFARGVTISGSAETMVEQPDHKILIGGFLQQWGGVNIPSIIRVDSLGVIDTTFHLGHSRITNVYGLALQPDGKVIATGWFDTINNQVAYGVVRLNSDGTTDPTFNAGAAIGDRMYINQIYPRSVSLRSNGKVILAGQWYSFNGTARRNIVQLNADGSIDQSFNRMGSANGDIRRAIKQSDGKLILGGLFDGYQDVPSFDIVRTDANGSVDTTFNTHGVLPQYPGNAGVNALAQQADGKIVVGGVFDNFGNTGANNLGRFNANGGVDTSFHTGSGANDQVLVVAVDASNKILVGGVFSDINGISQKRLARLNIDGSIDTSFHTGTGFNGMVDVIKVLPNGKIMAGGNFSTYNGAAAYSLIRLNNDGTADTSFHLTANLSYIYDIDILASGKILVSGFNYNYRPILLFNEDGTIDASFTSRINTGSINTAEVLSDGKIFVGGSFSLFGSPNNIGLLYPDGSIEHVWQSGTGVGTNADVLGSLIQNNDVIYYGVFTDVSGIGRNRIARLTNFCVMPASPTGALRDTICAGSTATLHINAGTGTLGWYSDSLDVFSYLAGGTSFTTDLLYSSKTYYVQDSTCDRSFMRTPVRVEVNQPPTIRFTSSVDTICAGSPMTVHVSNSAGNTLHWSTGATIDSIVVSPVAPKYYSLTATTARGCTSTDSFRVEVYPTTPPAVHIVELPTGVSIATGGTASATDYYGSNYPADAFDGDSTLTGWGSDGNGFPSWLAYDFGAGRSKVVRAYSFYNSKDMRGGWGSSEYNPVSWTFEGSNDSITWTVLDTIADGQINIGELKYFFSSNTNSYRRYRFNFTYTVDGDYVRLTDVKMFEADSQFCRDRSYLATGNNFASITGYQWKVKGASVGTNSPYLTLPKVRYGDSISCVITGTAYCALPNTASGYIKVSTAPNNTTVVNGGTITSNELGANYQWIKCGPVKRDIPGKTNVSYTPDSSGDYAVIVLKGSCVDTSLCISFTKPTGINDVNEEAIAFTIYPNPNNGSFMLTSSVAGEYSLINELGQRVQSLRLEANVPYHLTNEALSSGIYYLIANDQKHMVRNKVVVVK